MFIRQTDDGTRAKKQSYQIFKKILHLQYLEMLELTLISNLV